MENPHKKGKLKMKIKKVTDEMIMFDDGSIISFDHDQDCCEWNYADFSILNPNVVNYDYDFPAYLQFKPVTEMGFKFGCDGHWIFIPCYSEQNGYYSDRIDIYFRGHIVIEDLTCKFVDR